jgi:hypothetical protein
LRLSPEELWSLEQLKAEAISRVELARPEPGREHEALRQGIAHIYEPRSVATEH